MNFFGLSIYHIFCCISFCCAQYINKLTKGILSH